MLDLKIGQIFEDKYEILKVLGQGGMGKVYLARHVKLGTLWAIKQVNKESDVSVDLLAEPNIMKQLNHPRLPRIFDIVDTSEAIFIVVDYVQGESLDKVLKRAGKIPEPVLVAWAKQICDVYIYLHEHQPHPIIYRDMKPSNLMETPDGEVRVIDFGIAREYKKESKTDTQVLGTKIYAAPEQYGSAQTDERSDIYSLGVTLYQLATGESPNAAILSKPIRKVLPESSEGLEEILGKMLKPDPAERYQTARELLDDFSNIEKMSSRYKKARRKKSEKVGALIVSVLVFFALTLSGFSQVKAENLKNYQTLVKQGTALAAAYQYGKAQRLFDEAIHREPHELGAYEGTAGSLYLQKKYDEEIKYIQTVTKNIPGSAKDPRLIYELGAACLEKKDYENAITLLRKVSAASPKTTVYQRDLAVALARAKQLSAANLVLQKMNKEHIADEVTWYVQAEIASASGNDTQAAAQYKKVLTRGNDPSLKLRSVLALADLYKIHASALHDQHLDQRIAILKQGLQEIKGQDAMQLTEMLAEAYHEKGSAGQNRNGFNKLSVNLFKQLIANGYERPYLYRNIAIIYQEMNDYKGSEKVLLAMKKKYPTEYTCYIQLALLYADMENSKPAAKRNYSRVVKNYQLALKYSPDGANDPELAPLSHLIDELKANHWIK
ncbi:serine/threonine-protein kinase [Sporolactobacillus vineae]|uniref:serine/threonine-protein kinase n=1 Tax=Sporolactobacillus vineae TaxID=444463 RepID=UPI0002F1B033|nr:serine/threonine-protein kinase [Sporolactobacillus vineae]